MLYTIAVILLILWLAGFAVVLAVDAALSGTDVVHLPAAPATVIVLVAVTAFVMSRVRTTCFSVS